jgi:hypothetical protein
MATAEVVDVDNSLRRDLLRLLEVLEESLEWGFVGLDAGYRPIPLDLDVAVVRESISQRHPVSRRRPAQSLCTRDLERDASPWGLPARLREASNWAPDPNMTHRIICSMPAAIAPHSDRRTTAGSSRPAARRGHDAAAYASTTVPIGTASIRRTGMTGA